jgi:hypothetical protein
MDALNRERMLIKESSEVVRDEEVTMVDARRRLTQRSPACATGSLASPHWRIADGPWSATRMWREVLAPKSVLLDDCPKWTVRPARSDNPALVR